MSQTFAQWLRMSHKDERGTIQQPQGPLRIAYIRPDAFPEERLFFSMKDWPITVLHSALQGRPVIFDIEPQPEWEPKLSAASSNVRLLPKYIKPPSPGSRPSYTVE